MTFKEGCLRSHLIRITHEHLATEEAAKANVRIDGSTVGPLASILETHWPRGRSSKSGKLGEQAATTSEVWLAA